MLKATLRNLGAHKLRLLMSALAVVLGVAFVAGTFVFTDTLGKTFNELFTQTETDVVVTPASAFTPNQTAGVAASLPGETLDQVRAVDGVKRAEGTVLVDGVTLVDDEGNVIGSPGAPHYGVSWSDDAALSPVSLVDGRAPVGDNEIAIDTQAAKQAGVEVGDRIRVVTPGPSLEPKIVGVFRYGTTGNLAGASLTAFEPAVAQELLLGGDRWSEVDVLAKPGVSQQVLAERITAALGEDVKVQTGEEAQDEAAAQLTQALSFINTFLLVFAFIALFVGCFIILNTFSMLVAQRTRELALLRAIGASRRQVTSSVLGESLVVGIVGGIGGLLLGLGLAVGLRALFAALGIEIPAGSLVIAPRTIIVAMVVGIVVTVGSAYFPARRAAHIPPVAAMRDDIALPTHSLHVRAVVGTVLAAAGAVALAVGLAGMGPQPLALVGVGALLVFVGVAVLSPSISRPIVGFLGAPVRRLWGAVGVLAVGNAQRNRRRTASTASALMIGLALVAAIGTLGASTTASTDATIDRVIGADYIVLNPGFQPFSTQVRDAVSDVDGVGAAVGVMQTPALVNGNQVLITGLEAGPASEVVSFELVDGSFESVDVGMVVDEETAKADGISVGDTVEVTWLSGPKSYRVGGIYVGAGTFNGYVVGRSLVVEAGNPDLDFVVYVKAEEGVEPTSIRTDLEAALEPFPTVELQSQAEFKEQIRSQINQLLSLVYALLGLAVVIAILGIINTLALSVIERTREIGLLRAVGMTRGQLRRMVRLESVVIAVYGAVLGIALGLAFGVALQRALVDQGIEVLSIPWGLLIAVLVVAAFVGVFAAVWPARRAARLDVLQAVTTE